MNNSFDEAVFRARVNSALDRVKTVLDNTRTPQYAADVSHEYSDKFLLAEFLTQSAIAAHHTALEVIGANEKILAQLKEWSQQRNVTLRLRAEEQCKFLRKATREVESDTKHVTTSVFGARKDFTVTKITEYFWAFTAQWEIVAFPGTDADKAVVVHSHSGNVEIKTTVENTPKPESVVRPAVDVNITWFLHHLSETGFKPKFSIDRTSKRCRTPRRNPEIEDALAFFRKYYDWATSVGAYFTNTLLPVQADHGLDINALYRVESIFVPVLPLFEKQKEVTPYLLEDKTASSSSSSSSDNVVLPGIYSTSFLGEQVRTLNERLKDLSTVFPTSDKLVTFAEAKVVNILLHTKKISESYSESVDYIENMLYKQLVAAIGKEVGPVDFTNYLTFHNRKFFRAGYQPNLFCYAIRRPEHYPEGTLSIEAQLDDGAIANPIPTIVSHNLATRPMYFPINASTKVAFNGDRYLHGYVSHQFSGYSGTNLSLVARARQFSSFILLVGRIVSADLFEPKHGIIIQNRDELKIPLILETIPTPKEFRDAIESLSPEQQRFCKAFRSMQLESTLFGVCIIQIKPQLEKLLKLSDDSLTKEIQLTQDLLSLFIKYQIPSDLISYDGAEREGVAHKIGVVKGYVSNMLAMIQKAKQGELDEARQEKDYRLAGVSNDVPTTTVYFSSPSIPMARPSSVFRSSGGPPPPGGAPPPAASAPPPPASVPTTTPTPVEPTSTTETPQYDHEALKEQAESTAGGTFELLDYTKVPVELDKKFEEFDEDSALRPTIINTGTSWNKKFYKSLLASQETTTLHKDQQEKERNSAFDLLDALTKSGALSLDQASLHVVIAATHCFDKTLMQTVVQDNVNPIDKVENSSLIVASTIHRVTPAELIAPEHLARVSASSPLFLLEGKKAKHITGSASSVDVNNNNNRTA